MYCINKCKNLEIRDITTKFGNIFIKMKRNLKTYTFYYIIVGFMFLVSCNKKTTPVNAPGPSLNTNNVSANSTLNNVGIGAAWTSYGCQVGQTCLTTVNTTNNTTVTVCFSATPSQGVYQFVSSSALLAPGKAFMTVFNPPSQQSGSVWYSTSGTTTVNISSGAISSFFTNIPCLSNPVPLDTVSVSGMVGCL